MKTAIVFGGSTGIGRGIADAWAAAGHRVVTYNRSRPQGPSGNVLEHVHIDLRNPQETANTIARTLPEQIDAVCYSSVFFTSSRARLLDCDPGDWADQWRINVHGLWLALRASLPALRRARPGIFVSVSSEVVYNAGPDRSGYAATKAAARSLLESVALEERDEAIRFVQVMPAEMVDSPGIRARRPADFDYSDYMTGADFAPFATDVLSHRITGPVNDAIVVHKGGRYSSTVDELPRSQSRPLGVLG